MSEISDISEARKKIDDTLKLIVELDDNLLGAMIVDEEGLPLTFYSKPETFDLDVGPEEEEALGGTIIDAYTKLTELLGKDRLNLGELKRSLIEGEKGTAILLPLKPIKGMLLVYGTTNVKIGFVWTILNEIEGKLSALARVAYGV